MNIWQIGAYVPNKYFLLPIQTYMIQHDQKITYIISFTNVVMIKKLC